MENNNNNNDKIVVWFEIENDGQKPNSRAWQFGHHNGCDKEDTHLMKMTAVQLIEALLLREVDPELIEMNMDHCGHMDDLIALAIKPAAKEKKLKSLYHFALAAQARDCYGMIGNNLLFPWQAKIINKTYENYHNLCREKLLRENLDYLKLEQKLECAKLAAAELVNCLRVDPPKFVESRIIPNPDSYVIEETRDGICMVEALDGFNPFTMSKFFYDKGARIMIVYRQLTASRIQYHILARSPYEANFTKLWAELTSMDPVREEWGGSTSAGGSPRPRSKEGFTGGSELEPRIVYDLILRKYNNIDHHLDGTMEDIWLSKESLE